VRAQKAGAAGDKRFHVREIPQRHVTRLHALYGSGLPTA
jgi:hypothetical protein